MVTLDNLVVTNALVSIREDLGASLEQLEWTVNAYTLSYAVFLLTAAALGDRFGRRRVFAVGIGLFTLVLGRRGARAEHRRADRRPRAPGTRRRGDHAAVAHAAERGVRGGEARAGARHLVGRVRPRRRARPGGRRRGRRGLLLAVDLLAERADRAARWPRRPCACCARAAARTRPSTCPASRSRARGLLGVVFGIVRAQAARLDEHDGDRLDRRRASRCSRRFAAWETRTRTPMLPMRFFRNRGVRGHQRRVAGDVLRRLRVDLPAGAVLPGGPGLLAARGRAAHAAVDGDADLRRAGRGHPVRPDRQPAADGGGPGAAGGRARVDRAGHRARTWPTGWSCPAS